MIGLGLLQLRRWRNLSTIRTSDSTRHHHWRCQEKIVTNPPTNQTHPGCHDCLHIVQAKQLDGACLHVIQSTYNTGQQSSFGKLISGWCASRVHIKYTKKTHKFHYRNVWQFRRSTQTLTDVNSTAHIPIILQLLLRQQEKKVQRACVPWSSIISNTIHTTVYQPLHVHLFTLPKSELFQIDHVSKSGGRQIYYIYYTKHHHHHRHHPSILCLELDHICQVTHSVTSLRTRRWRN